jgi:DNA-binding NarL/FixJ family response regulator
VTVRVLLADDHPVFLDGLRMLLDSTPGISVAGTASDGAGLVELASRVEFDAVVVDLDMPGTDGPTATRSLLEQHPDAAVLVLTMHDDTASVERALRAGARGYVLKGAGHGTIARAVLAVADGDTVLSGGVGGAVVRAATSSRPAPQFPMLSAREAEVLRLVARGLPNGAIAQELFLSVKTVQNHLSSLLTKTGAGSRAELVALARDAGVGTE